MECNEQFDQQSNNSGKCHAKDGNEREIIKRSMAYGCLMVVGSFFINFISDGIMCSFGVIYIQLLDEFREGKGYTSWILSMCSGMALCAGPVSSSCVNKFGFRVVTIGGAILAALSLLVSYWAQNVFTLIITIGFGLGCGLGLVYLPAIVSVTTYFEKYRSVAVGIAVSGSGVGTFIMAPLVNHLTGIYGWRGTLLILSGIVLNCAIFGALFRPFQPKTTKENTLLAHHHCDENLKQNEISPKKRCCENVSLKLSESLIKLMNLDLLKSSVFVLFAISDFATSAGYYVPYFCLVDYAMVVGVSAENASHLLAIIGLTNTLGRIFWGYISDRPWINRLWLYNISLIVCGFATIASVFCHNFETLAIYSAVFGFTIGAYISLRAVILVDLLGVEKLNDAFGLLLWFEGIATFLGPPIVGFLYDLLKSYTPGFLLAGLLLALSGLMLFLMPILRKNVAKNAANLDIEA